MCTYYNNKIINIIQGKYANLMTFKISVGGIGGLNPTSTNIVKWETLSTESFKN